jgi:hypothetical protein
LNHTQSWSQDISQPLINRPLVFCNFCLQGLLLIAENIEFNMFELNPGEKITLEGVHNFPPQKYCSIHTQALMI